MNPPLIGPFRRGVSPIIGPKWSRRRRGGPTRGQSYDASPDDEKAGGETPYDEMRHTSRADDDTAHGENPLSFLAPGTFLPDEKAGEVEAQAGSAASDPARHDGPAAGRRHNGPANGDTPRRKGPINGKRRGRLGVRELLGEALAGVAARPTRLVLTTLGTVLGIAALVGTLGLGQTASGQITQRFDLAVATRVAVEPGQQDGADGQSQAETALPWDAPERVQRLNGVEAAGTYSRLDVGNDLVRSVAVVDPRRDDAYQLAVVAASPGLFDAVRGTLRTGRYFDAGHDRRRDRVVVLGKNAAARLGINR
ncbi:MAG TPA: ABC transporter permease, partial [Kribbellaceae bacterium]